MATTKKEHTGIEQWSLKVTGSQEDVPRGLVAFGKGCGGNMMWVMVPRTGASLLVHAVGKKPNETATAWRGDDGRAPSAPTTPMDIKTAVDDLKALQRAFPKEGPAVLRGSWSGKLVCENGTPRVELARKIVSYGVLTVTSTPKGRWVAKFAREQRWFTEAAVQEVEKPDLAAAIQAGMGLVVGLVSEACTVQHMQRRVARDPEYAATRPPRPAPRPIPDPIGKYAASREKIPAAKSVPAPSPCPTCPDGIAKGAQGIALNAGQLAKATPSDDVAEAPAALGRAGKLIARARELLASPLCSGPEAKDGHKAIKDAETAYEAARKAYTTGNDADIDLQTNLRRIAEKVALAAAKAARSCKTGQQTLPGTGSKAATPPAAPAKAKRGGKKAPTDAASNQLILAGVKDAVRDMAAQLRAGAL